MTSLVPVYFTAGYSLNMAMQYPLLVPFLCVVCGLVLRHHPLVPIGSIGGTVLAASVAHYHGFESYTEQHAFVAIFHSFFSLFTSDWGTLATVFSRLSIFTFDFFTLDASHVVAKYAYWMGAIALHTLVRLMFTNEQMDNPLRVIKMDIVVFLFFGGGMSIVLGYLKNQAEKRKKE